MIRIGYRGCRVRIDVAPAQAAGMAEAKTVDRCEGGIAYRVRPGADVAAGLFVARRDEMVLKALQPKVRIGKQTKLEVRKVADPLYLSTGWRALVADLIARRGRRCEHCGKTSEDDGSPVRLVGDHVVERRDGGADFDPSNIELLCCRAGGNGAPHGGKRGNCHAAKTARARHARFGHA